MRFGPGSRTPRIQEIREQDAAPDRTEDEACSGELICFPWAGLQYTIEQG